MLILPGSNLKAEVFQLIVKWRSGCGESNREEVGGFTFIPGQVIGQRVHKQSMRSDFQRHGKLQPTGQEAPELLMLKRASTWLSEQGVGWASAQLGSKARALSTGLQEAALHVGGQWQSSSECIFRCDISRTFHCLHGAQPLILWLHPSSR